MSQTATGTTDHIHDNLTGSAALPPARELARRRVRVDEALADMYDDVPEDLAERFGLRAHRVGGAVALVAAKLPVALFNRAVNLGAVEPATEADVDRVVGIYLEAGVPFMVQLSPIASPAELPAWLAARGVPQGDPWAVFARGLHDPPEVATDLRVERVGPDQAGPFSETFAAGYGLPAAMVPLMAVLVGRPYWHHYLAFDGATPVAAASMFADGETARFTGAGTVETHRRRGGQGALLARRLRDAAALGCTVVTVETAAESPERPNASFRNMRRAGFELAYLQPNHVFAPTAP